VSTLRRLYKRYYEQGDRGLVHQGRGQSGKILTLVLRRQLALDGHMLDHETLRSGLLKADCGKSELARAGLTLAS
jgi:hypothetical protein